MAFGLNRKLFLGAFFILFIGMRLSLSLVNWWVVTGAGLIMVFLIVFDTDMSLGSGIDG
jgi:hypothetical protein